MDLSCRADARTSVPGSCVSVSHACVTSPALAVIDLSCRFRLLFVQRPYRGAVRSSLSRSRFMLFVVVAAFSSSVGASTCFLLMFACDQCVLRSRHPTICCPRRRIFNVFCARVTPRFAARNSVFSMCFIGPMFCCPRMHCTRKLSSVYTLPVVTRKFNCHSAAA